MAANVVTTGNVLPLPITLAAENYGHFRHAPLNHCEPSIRLVHILPSLSPEGHIQCTIVHTTVNATYTCLSYRWGDQHPSHVILVDGKTFEVGQNLYDFLSAARYKAESRDGEVLEPYWIDALTVDQGNTFEKNHQVAQMSRIYSNAVLVYVWLGTMPPDIFLLLQIIRKAKECPYDGWDTLHSKRDIFDKHIFQNEYWTRAWITQEIVLARHVCVWLERKTVPLMELIEAWTFFYQSQDAAYHGFSQFTHGWRKPLTSEGCYARKYQRPQGLIYLLAHFRDKRCHNIRDRIFSLLSLVCGDGKDLEVDYDITPVNLAAQVLLHCKDSVCFCSAILVVQKLGLAVSKSLETGYEASPYLEFVDSGSTRSFGRNLRLHTASGTTYFKTAWDSSAFGSPSFRISLYDLAKIARGRHFELCQHAAHPLVRLEKAQAREPWVCWRVMRELFPDMFYAVDVVDKNEGREEIEVRSHHVDEDYHLHRSQPPYETTRFLGEAHHDAEQLGCFPLPTTSPIHETTVSQEHPVLKTRPWQKLGGIFRGRALLG